MEEIENEAVLSPQMNNLKDQRRQEDRKLFKHRTKEEDITQFMVDLSDERTKEDILEEINKMQ